MPSFNSFIQFCLDTCNSNSVGYSEDFRYAQSVSYNEAVNWDNNYSGYAWNYHYDWTYYTGTGSGNHTYYDCSSWVSYALQAAGFSNGVFTTGVEENTLSSLGWKKLDNGNSLQQGDIGWRDGHTEICYQGGVAGSSAIFMGAHGRRGKTSSPPYNFYYQVSIGDKDGNSNAHATFTHYWRYYNWDDEEPIPETTVDPISDILIYALCGNAWQESLIDPQRWERGIERSWNAIWENNTGGYGLWGFTNTSEDNMFLEELWTYCTNNNLAMYDGYAQCKFLQSGEGNSQHWYYSSNMYEASSVTCHTWDSWCNNWKGYSDDLWQMTYDFFRCWEGIHDGTENIRYECALKCQEYVPQHLEDESITDWIYGNRSLSENETLNNAVMLYRAMQTIHGSSGNYTHDYGGNGTNGDSGIGDTKEEIITWENFLLSGLGRNNTKNTPLHIIRKRRK